MISIKNEQIYKSITFSEVLAAMENAILANDAGQIYTPQRMHINVKQNTFLTMPCFGEKYFSTKLVSVFPDNADKGIPLIFGTVILNDGDTGKPLAILDGKAITALRTGAIGGLSVKYLVPENIENIGVIGTGVQGLHQALFACTVRKNIKNIWLVNRSAERLAWFEQEFKAYFPNINLHKTKNTRELLQKSQLIITATTSPTPLLPNDANLLKGKHFLAVGSYKPDMRELPEALFSLVDKVYVDTFHAIEESGDLAFPMEKGLLKRTQIDTLAQHIRQQTQPTNNSQTTLFKSVGLAAFDLFAAALVYERRVVVLAS